MKRDSLFQKQLQVLGFSLKEEKVLLAIRDGLLTPLLISQSTKVTRPSVYDILKKLKSRGLIESYILDGKKGWRVQSSETISKNLYEAKKAIVNSEIEKEEIKSNDGGVIVYRGRESLRKKVVSIFSSRNNEKFSGLTAYDRVVTGWMKILGNEGVNETNELIKKNKLISDSVFSDKWLEKSYEAMGMEWAKRYEGRTASTAYIDEKYFNFSSQIFAFRDTLYLFSLEDEMIIEIKHNEIQKMILSMYQFMKDHGEKVDANKILRDLMEKEKDL